MLWPERGKGGLDVHTVNSLGGRASKKNKMPRPQKQQPEKGQPQIVLGLLEAVERDGGQSQRHLAAELNIALGLVNTYLARCIRKGLVKARQAPARRYFYYLTPRGFAEKSQLTMQFLSSSFGFFRQAKLECTELFQQAQGRGQTRLALAGKSDLAEIAALCAAEGGIEIVAVVDEEGGRFLGRPVALNFDAVGAPFDAVIITDLKNTRRTNDAAVARFGTARVLMPDLLRGHFRPREGAAS